MKSPTNATLKEFLLQSPVALRDFMMYGHSLGFEQKPDYRMLRGILKDGLRKHGWNDDGLFDWMRPSLAPRGTLLSQEYKHMFHDSENLAPTTVHPIKIVVNQSF
jgi:hypothetical protein